MHDGGIADKRPAPGGHEEDEGAESETDGDRHIEEADAPGARGLVWLRPRTAGILRCAQNDNSNLIGMRKRLGLELLWDGGSERCEKVDGGAQDNLVLLVVALRGGSDDAVLRARFSESHADNLNLGAERIAGTNGFSPAHLIDAGADHASGDLEGLDAEAHNDRGGKPARGG